MPNTSVSDQQSTTTAVRNTVCITGASGGLGYAYGEAFARQGHPLLLIDKDSDTLRKTAEQLAAISPAPIATKCVDLADREQLAALASQLKELDEIAVLVNNAGFSVSDSFMATPEPVAEAMVDVHVLATVKLCKAVLPRMIGRKSGTIINVASLGGFKPGRSDLLYGATKRFVIHFSKSLQLAVKADGISIQALCPGFIRTGFHNAGGYSEKQQLSIPPLLWMTAEKVVSISLQNMRKNSVICIPGIKSWFLLFCVYTPLLWRFIGGVTRRMHKIRNT